MKIQSLIRDKNSLVPVEVELTLWPGLPGIQFLGLPDQHLKESAFRIKSAIKYSGFKFPTAQQILVNLRPSHLKKTSRGLELAVAAAYLWETGQLTPPILDSDFFIYGELTLMGEVIEPEDLHQSFAQKNAVVLTGKIQSDEKANFRRQLAHSLTDINTPQDKAAERTEVIPQRPQAFLAEKFSSVQARLLEILAVGEHSALLAGAAGSGKTTVAKALPSFLREPDLQQFQDLRKIHFEFGMDLSWRPVVKPHHSTPIMAMVGGGSLPFAGEISRAHGGVLILDEFLEFSNSVQEALREPFEEGKMRVMRNGKMREYLAEAQIIATTNLCPCGQWTPENAKTIQCKRSGLRCRSYSQRLSGPLIDRFELIEFNTEIGELEHRGIDILATIEKAQKFSLQQFGNWKANARRPFNEIFATLGPQVWKLASSEEMTSQRRKVATLRVARTLADLEQSPLIEIRHIKKALVYTRRHFEQLWATI